MSHDPHEADERRREEDEASDKRLRALLPSYVVPKPSACFVSDTVLRVRLDQHKIPEPSVDFVDRVLARVQAEKNTAGTANEANEQLVPVVDLSRYAATEVEDRPAARRLPLAMAITGLAAALALAFWVGRQSVSDPESSNESLVRIQDFPSRGSNRFARSLSLVVDRIHSRFDDDEATQLSGGQEPGGLVPVGTNSPAWPRPVLSLPAPPSNLIPTAVMDAYVDPATLKSLGMGRENL